jgi:hypothetical protein
MALTGEILLVAYEGTRSIARHTTTVPVLRRSIFQGSRFTGTTET